MATSAATLELIINSLAENYGFTKDSAILYLADKDLLPNKLKPKIVKNVSLFASKRAEELATQHHITPEGEGSGKNGKWTLADVEKHMSKPTKSKLLVSPNALNLANEKGISLVGKTGSGKDGRILLKDVESWIADSDDEEEQLNISPRALQEAEEQGVPKKDLSTIHGTGKDGRILLSDVQKHISASEESSDEDED
jgi:pyruvate/2-oxoglutarate dehydrogenase complex dihydrolipoamide acyltransferase (E2) component